MRHHLYTSMTVWACSVLRKLSREGEEVSGDHHLRSVVDGANL